MLEARSVALVGASARPGSLGARMIAEVARSPSRPRTYLVNPRYSDIDGAPCLPDLAAVPEPVDLALLAVPDHALEQQLSASARSQARSEVIFGNAFDPPGRTGLRSRLAAIAGEAGLALCGAGCMGFVNVARGLRAIGYVEPDPLPSGPVGLVTHSGSVFSALLRTRRGFGFSLVVSSGQELVTTAADYARYALGLAETKVLALVLEAIRDAPGLRAVLADALAADVPVVLLSVGASQAGQALVSAHSGALAAADGAWEALAVDLVPEFDGDESYPEAVLTAAAGTAKPVAPVTRSAALAALRRLRIAPVLAGSRGQPAADLGAIADAIAGLSRLACDLGDALEASTSTPSSAPPPAPSPSTPSSSPGTPAPSPPTQPAPPRPLSWSGPAEAHPGGLGHRYDRCE